MNKFIKGESNDWTDYAINSIANQTGWSNNSEIQLLYQTNNLTSFNLSNYLYNNQNLTQIVVTFYTMEYFFQI